MPGNLQESLKMMQDERFGTAKIAFAAVPKKTGRCPGVSKHLRFPAKSHFFFSRSDGCYVESNREVVAYMSSAAIAFQNARSHLGFTVQEHVKEKLLAFNCSSILVWICGTEEVLDSPFWHSLNLRHWSSLVERRTGIHT